ncbi:MAG: hypothetical protein FJ388_05195 [Verrucomicrobia bacterium]|nr:hypothetical protein [Verrucomicrobiota bacterium]
MKRLALMVVGCPWARRTDVRRHSPPATRHSPRFRPWARALGGGLLLAGSLATSFAASSFVGLGVLPGGTRSDAVGGTSSNSSSVQTLDTSADLPATIARLNELINALRR